MTTAPGPNSNDDSSLHPRRLTAFFNAFVVLLSLCLSRQDPKKGRYEQDVSIFDLSPLYGVTSEETDTVRAKDGRGMLSPDCFFDRKVLNYPLTVVALLVLWNRNHNYIARQLLLHNERKRWNDPSNFKEATGDQFSDQDNEIFELARRINCIQFMNTVETDFLRVVAGHGIEENPALSRKPGSESKIGTQYRVLPSKKREEHASTSVFQLLYQQSPFYSHDEAVFAENVHLQEPVYTTDPKTWSFHTLERGPDARFKDEALASILMNANETMARQPTIAASKNAVDAINPDWRSGSVSLNSLRTFIGLSEHKKYESWNPTLVDQAKGLYADVKELDAYVGAMAEAIPEPSKAGRVPVFGETLSKALVVDLATFIETDKRVSSKGITEVELTTWGKEDCTDIPDNGSCGAWMPRLLQRSLPRHYTYNSVFSLFPLFQLSQLVEVKSLLAKEPSTLSNEEKASLKQKASLKFFFSSLFPKVTWTNLGTLFSGEPDKDDRTKFLEGFKQLEEQMYKFGRPHTSPVKIINTKEAMDYVFKHPEEFPVMYGDDIQSVSNGYRPFICIDDIRLHDKDLMMTMFALHPDPKTVFRYADFFEKTASGLISELQLASGGKNELEIDLVNDVINKTCTRWVCQTLCGIDSFGAPQATSEKKGVILLLLASFYQKLSAYVAEFTKPAIQYLSRIPQVENLIRFITQPISGPKPISEDKWHEYFGHLYALVFRNGDPQNGWVTRNKARIASQELFDRIDSRMSGRASPRYILAHRFFNKGLKDTYILHYVERIATTLQAILGTTRRIGTEFTTGVHIPQFNSAVFLERMNRSSHRPEFALGRATLEDEYLRQLAERIMAKDKSGDFMGWQDVKADVFKIIQREDALQNKRVVANIVGLAMATAIHYAQTCALAVDFYLHKDRKDHFEEIRRLASLDQNEAKKENANKKIMQYIREAQRIGQPFGVWRKANKDNNDLPGDLDIKEGDKVFIDFGAYHMSDAFDSPQEIRLDRHVSSLQGLGLHRCPGMDFVENTMPELFKVIFRLKDLRLSPNGGLVRVHQHTSPLPSDPRLFLDETGALSPYPRTMKITFNPEPTSDKVLKASLEEAKGTGIIPLRIQNWLLNLAAAKKLQAAWKKLEAVLISLGLVETPSGPQKSRQDRLDQLKNQADKPKNLVHVLETHGKMAEEAVDYGNWVNRRSNWREKLSNRLLVHILVIAMISMIVSSFRQSFSIMGFFGYAWSLVPSRSIPRASESKPHPTNCPTPKIFDHPHVEEFLPGPDGFPVPIVYTINDSRSHRFSFVDIDEKDVRMSIWVDDVNKGLTPDFELNKAQSCGDDINLCIRERFSAGMVIVGGGKHTIKLQYEGNELYPNKTTMNWGENKFRRIKVWKEWCN